MLVVFDPGSIAVGALVAHKVPRRMAGDPVEAITVSEAVPQLPQPTLGFFRGRLSRTLAAQGQDVEEDSGRDGRVIPPLAKSFLAGETELLPFSQQAAQHLYASQIGSSSEGLLVACDLTVGGASGVALMKLEEEKGVIVEDTLVDNMPTLSVTIEEHLLLTDNTRVFKAAVFWMSGTDLLGNVSDEQQGDRTGIADYFLGAFLGCRLTKKPDVLTRDFYDTVTKYISTDVADPARKLQYQRALHTEIDSNRTRIHPTNFAQEHFETGHRTPMIQALGDAGVPEQAFRKDVGRLGSKLTSTRLRTQAGITITGSANVIGERVESTVIDEERVIVIHDTLTDVN